MTPNKLSFSANMSIRLEIPPVKLHAVHAHVAVCIYVDHKLPASNKWRDIFTQIFRPIPRSFFPRRVHSTAVSASQINTDSQTQQLTRCDNRRRHLFTNIQHSD